MRIHLYVWLDQTQICAINKVVIIGLYSYSKMKNDSCNMKGKRESSF